MGNRRNERRILCGTGGILILESALGVDPLVIEVMGKTRHGNAYAMRVRLDQWECSALVRQIGRHFDRMAEIEADQRVGRDAAFRRGGEAEAGAP